MKVIDYRLPKVCFAEAGQIIQLPNKDTGLPEGPFYLVTVIQKGKDSAMHVMKSNGLYSNPNDHLLVDIETGVLRVLPHLSSRMDVVGSATMIIGPVKEPPVSF